MDEQQKKKALKPVIIILAILLGISSAALVGTLIYKNFVLAGPSSVVVPDNIITPETKPDMGTQNELNGIIENTGMTAENGSAVEYLTTSGEIVGTDERAAAIYLYNRNPGDNIPFNVGNMFPGDVETKYFCVQVSYKDTVTVNYRADIRPGYEKLAEVLKCRVVLLTTGETMYNGLMRDMPKSLSHTLNTAGEAVDDLYYEITAYLDTSVGNAYQNKELIADFRWWVEGEERDHLIEPPPTGDESSLPLWFALMIGSLFLLILLFVTRKKEERHEQYR